MNQKAKIFVLILFLAILQVSFFTNIFPGKISPNALLIFLIILSVREDFKKIWKWAIFSGFILDVFSFERIGVNILSLFLISSTASFLSKRFFISQRLSVFFILGLIIVGTLFNYLLLFFLHDAMNLFIQEEFIYSKILKDERFIFELANNLILFILIYRPVVKSLESFKNKEKLITK